jgi:hypothetical protein
MKKAIERRAPVQSEDATVVKAKEQSAPADLDAQTTNEAVLEALKDFASLLAKEVGQLWEEGFDEHLSRAMADTLLVLFLEESKATVSLGLRGDLSKASLKLKVAHS